MQVAKQVLICMCALNAWLLEETPSVQVAVGSSRMAASHVCTLDNALVGTRKTPTVQVADNAHASASEVFALIDGTKNITSANCRGSRPSWALIGARCSNQLQLAPGYKP